MTRTTLIDDHLRVAAARRPDAPAVIEGDRIVSFSELDDTANRIARVLQDLGVERGDRVGLYLRKSTAAVEGLYGVLRAGAAYVPLDAAAPTARVAYIASNCGIRHLITGSDRSKAWGEVVGGAPSIKHLLVLDADETPAGPDSVTMHARADVMASAPVDAGSRIAQDLAYILYTSGSTGNPKGVMLTHVNCRAFVDWAVAEFGITGDDRVSSHAPFHFDLSTFDLFAAAAAAAPVVLVPPRLSVFPVEVVGFIEKNEISVWYSVPSILSMIVEHGNLAPGRLSSLRSVLFAGEVFPTKYLSRLMHLLPDADFANLYGPTETNVCTFHRVPQPPDESEPPVSIGRPIADVETFLVDAADAVVARGEVGELLVRGPTVMRGYWGDPERTATRLTPSPVERHLGDLVYRTGDLAIENEDGSYTFLGRRDNQIKSRGYRIELGDIEAALSAHPDVLECVVVAVPDEIVTNRLQAFVSLGAETTPQELTRFCAGRVQSYMLPEKFVILPELPKTSTGKFDRQALLREALEAAAE